MRYFEGFDLDDDNPVAAPRYANIWTIGDDGPWRGRIHAGVYHLINDHDPHAVRYGYVGLGSPGGVLDDLSDTWAFTDVSVGDQKTCPFSSAGLMFRFDRSRRFYTGLIVTRHVTQGSSRCQLQFVRRDARGLELTPLGGPLGIDGSQSVTLGIIGRSGQLDLFMDDRLIRSVPAPVDLRGDPGLLAIGTGEFAFDNFAIADVQH